MGLVRIAFGSVPWVSAHSLFDSPAEQPLPSLPPDPWRELAYPPAVPADEPRPPGGPNVNAGQL
jgi:hypothetical protein